MSKNTAVTNRKALAQSIFIGIACSFVMGTMAVLADGNVPSLTSLTDGYQSPAIPSRDQLISRIPTAPAIPTPDAATLRQAGATQLQQFSADHATDHGDIRTQLNNLSQEISHPSSSSSHDPLGNNVSTGENTQSTVSSNGSLPAGTLNAEPRASGLGQEAANRLSQDAVNSWYNTLAATVSLRAEIASRQTQKLADKLDEINNIHKDINNNLKQINAAANAVLMQLPTIPGV